MSTPNGVANFFADRFIEYFSNDGWHSLGDVTRDEFRLQFSDSTGYTPKNAFLPSSKLRRPLRWQPLQFKVDSRGHFASQIHVVPHIGIKAKPLLHSKREFVNKKVPGPYSEPNKRRKLSEKDNAMERCCA